MKAQTSTLNNNKKEKKQIIIPTPIILPRNFTIKIRTLLNNLQEERRLQEEEVIQMLPVDFQIEDVVHLINQDQEEGFRT